MLSLLISVASMIKWVYTYYIFMIKKRKKSLKYPYIFAFYTVGRISLGLKNEVASTMVWEPVVESYKYLLYKDIWSSGPKCTYENFLYCTVSLWTITRQLKWASPSLKCDNLENVLKVFLNTGIKHGFSCIDIRQVPKAAVFNNSQGTRRILMHWKTCSIATIA